MSNQSCEKIYCQYALSDDGGRNITVFGIGKRGCRVVDSMVNITWLSGQTFATVKSSDTGILKDGDVFRTPELPDMCILVHTLGYPESTTTATTIARIAKERKIFTLGIVSLPFSFEGLERAQNAKRGIEELLSVTDNAIAFQSDQVIDRDIGEVEAFLRVDEIFTAAVRMIIEVIGSPGPMSVDFADVKDLLRGGGVARVGFGFGDEDNRVADAVWAALTNPLLETSLDRSCRVLIWIRAARDTTIEQINQAVSLVEKSVDVQADLACAVTLDETMKERSFAIGIVVR